MSILQNTSNNSFKLYRRKEKILLTIHLEHSCANHLIHEAQLEFYKYLFGYGNDIYEGMYWVYRKENNGQTKNIVMKNMKNRK